jgi:hypothetical protein
MPPSVAYKLDGLRVVGRLEDVITQEVERWAIPIRRKAERRSGGSPTGASCPAKGEPVLVAGSGSAAPRQRRSMKKSAKAIGDQESPDAVAKYGDPTNAGRAIGAWTDAQIAPTGALPPRM